MDITHLLKKLDFSTAKIVLLSIFNKSGLYEYVLDRANTGVNMLLEAHAEELQAIRNRLIVINEVLARYAAYIPGPWVPYAEVVNQSLLEVVRATADNVITTDEAKACIANFKDAYSTFKAD